MYNEKNSGNGICLLNSSPNLKTNDQKKKKL